MELQHSERLYGDLLARSRSGIVIYPIFWGLIGYFTSFYTRFPALFWTLLSTYTVLSAARIGIMVKLNRASGRGGKADRHIFKTLLLLSPFIWGLTFAWALGDGDVELAVLMTISVAGIVAGGGNTFAPHRQLAIAFVAVTMLPAVFWTLAGFVHWLAGLMCFTYFIYVVVLTGQQYREYWQAIENERALQQQQLQLEQLSRTDVLTSLANRRYFNDKFDEYWSVCWRNESPLTLLLIDIDHFKHINDHYGHSAGDQALIQVGIILKQIVSRGSDMGARVGGEEFAILLPFTNQQGGEKLAEEILATIRQVDVQFDGRQFRFTASIGQATVVPNAELTPAKFYAMADAALYDAKHNGRDRLAQAIPVSTSIKVGGAQSAV